MRGGVLLDEIARALNVALLNQAHNGYLEVYLSLGWVGVTLLLVLIVTGYRKIAAGFRQDPDMSSLKIAFFVLVVIYNFTEGVFKTMSPVWLAFLLATMVVPLRMTPSRRQKSASEDSIADGTPDEARQLSPVAVKPRKISEPTPYPVRK